MILSFGDKTTADLYHERNTSRYRKIPFEIRASALVKLDMLRAASSMKDLTSPPGNRLEALKGDLEGYYSIRVNSQWRIIFV